ncbi:hypothetical protein [Chromobacterium sp. IIBBL 290-4]|uniref:hypothetical protein n=1 Tax=Chromobacterium sp. IIBBL 290-4 TaxID=2953890 RepID=UPI0020B6B977|nr:hypothetical protein [Chromobacterium sp. IIBBL 290-4]UTH73372.1 hypothetical protein NKT35_17795 [Chromobacterium sp. IIBBL 290-4]
MALKIDMPVWRDPEGNVVACVEKLKVMRENLEEIAQLAQDAFEDAVLMGCEENQVRDYLAALMQSLENPYRSE